MKYIVVGCLSHRNRRDKFKDFYRVFDKLETAKKRYKKYLKKERLYSVSICKVIKSTNYTTDSINIDIDWQEAHYEIVSAIEQELIKGHKTSKNKVVELYESNGRGAMWELSKKLTDKFIKLNEFKEWDGEFFDELDSFLALEFLKI